MERNLKGGGEGLVKDYLRDRLEILRKAMRNLQRLAQPVLELVCVTVDIHSYISGALL
jgi:hypothetical protein